MFPEPEKFLPTILTGNFLREGIANEVNMSEKVNTDIVQSGYEKFGSGDIEGLLQIFSDDVLWQVPEVENAPFTGTRQGISGNRPNFLNSSQA